MTPVRRTRRLGTVLTRLLAGAVLAALFVAVVSKPAGASTMRLFVNGASGHDTGACTSPLTPCATISYALAHAPSGAKIKVAPGTYHEQLNITQSVTIIGRSPKLTTIAPLAVTQNDTDPDSSAPQFAIVDVHNSNQAISIVNIEKLTIDGAAAGASSFSGCANNFPGIYFHNASGELIRDHVIDVEMSQSLFGCQTGAGIGIQVHSDAGSTSNVAMRHVNVNNYQKGGIACFDAGTTCSVRDSVVTGIGPTDLTAANGIQMWGTGSFTINHDTVSKNTYTGPSGPAAACGLLVINPGSVQVRNSTFTANDVDAAAIEDAAYGLVAPLGSWTFAGNKFENATDEAPAPFNAEGQGYGDGLAIDSSTTPVTITGNMAKSNFEYGIALYGARDVTMSNDGANSNYDGIYVGGPGSASSTSTGNTISGNRALSNKNDGVLADVTASDTANAFTGNALHGSGHFEAQDLSTGGGTAGTANTWAGNLCGSPRTASPAGIC
jgi:hypothetical protein